MNKDKRDTWIVSNWKSRYWRFNKKTSNMFFFHMTPSRLLCHSMIIFKPFIKSLAEWTSLTCLTFKLISAFLQNYTGLQLRALLYHTNKASVGVHHYQGADSKMPIWRTSSTVRGWRQQTGLRGFVSGLLFCVSLSFPPRRLLSWRTWRGKFGWKSAHGVECCVDAEV